MSIEEIFFEGHCKQEQSQDGLSSAECRLTSIFYQLIRVSLGNAGSLSHMPSAEEWVELYAIAKKQSLVGVCFAGVQKLQQLSLRPPKSLHLKWMGMAAKILQKNEIINRQCLELQERLAADGFRSCVLKGQGVGALYGSLALLRQSGDIDAWVDGDQGEVIAYVKRVCPNKGVDISSKHIEFRLFQDTEVEAHFIPAGSKTPIIGRRVKAYYEGEKDRQMVNKVRLATGQEITAPDAIFHAIHILQHAFGHFLFEGIGMRQLMDYYFVMQQPLSDEEKKSVTQTLKRLGMYRFARGVAYILTETFGGKECFIPADPGLGKRILKSVMEEGNFGKYDVKRDEKKMGSSWYRFWYHNVRILKYLDVAPWTILMSPFMRIHEYMWRFSHGYFKKK